MKRKAETENQRMSQDDWKSTNKCHWNDKIATFSSEENGRVPPITKSAGRDSEEGGQVNERSCLCSRCGHVISFTDGSGPSLLVSHPPHLIPSPYWWERETVSLLLTDLSPATHTGPGMEQVLNWLISSKWIKLKQMSVHTKLFNKLRGCLPTLNAERSSLRMLSWRLEHRACLDSCCSGHFGYFLNKKQ